MTCRAEKVDSIIVRNTSDRQVIHDKLALSGLKITDLPVEGGDNLGTIGDLYVVFDVKSLEGLQPDSPFAIAAALAFVDHHFHAV